jgi:hypothetical protein
MDKMVGTEMEAHSIAIIRDANTGSNCVLVALLLEAWIFAVI